MAKVLISFDTKKSAAESVVTVDGVMQSYVKKLYLSLNSSSNKPPHLKLTRLSIEGGVAKRIEETV